MGDKMTREKHREVIYEMYLRYLKLPTPETNNIRDLRARYLFGERSKARDTLLKELQSYKNTYGVLPNIPGINNVIRDTELENIGIEDDGKLLVKYSDTDERSKDAELRNAHGIILKQRNKIKYAGKPSQEQMQKIADKNRFKTSGKINYTKVGKEIGTSSHTAQRYCDEYSIK